MKRTTNKNKRNDGRYMARFYKGTNSNGVKEYAYFYGNTKTEACEKRNKAKEEFKTNKYGYSDNDTFEVWSKDWLSMRKGIGESQINGLKCYLKHLNNNIGNKRINEIMNRDIQRIINNLADENPNTHKPSSKETLKKIRHTAEQVFDYAIKNNAINHNPANNVEIPSNAPASKRDRVTQKEMSIILNTEHRMKAPAMIMLFAGLRRGEVIPLTWRDINLEDGIIKVHQSASLVHNQPYLKSTKTEKSERTVFIPNVLIDYLKKEKELRKSYLVCPNAQGKMHTDSSWRRGWDSYVESMNLKENGIEHKITAHMLRHTFSSLLFNANVSPKVHQDQMGHSCYSTTMDIYTHLSDDIKKEQMNKFNDYLNNMG